MMLFLQGRRIGIALCVLALLIAAPGAGLARYAHAARSAASSKFHHPNLKGQSVTFIVGSTPQPSDTTVYKTTQILKSWGANAKLLNVDGDPLALRAVLAGSADVVAGNTSTLINGGVKVFGPNQPHVDYFMVGRGSLKKISQLPGHSFAVSNTAGLEALMLKLELHKHHIPLSAVPEVISGSADVRVQAMLSGRIDATFAHFDGWLTLKGHQTHILATVARDIPRLADSFLAAQPGWLQSHQKLATAIDEAYLESAHYFQTHEKGWIAAARVYTSDQTSTQGALAGIYKTLKKANLYPDDGSGFSSKVLRFNENAANTVGALTASPPPLSQWVITKYWKTAVKAVLHHSPK